jgi:hypothetical protein
MGHNTALDFAELDLEQGIAYHLQGITIHPFHFLWCNLA